MLSRSDFTERALLVAKSIWPAARAISAPASWTAMNAGTSAGRIPPWRAPTCIPWSRLPKPYGVCAHSRISSDINPHNPAGIEPVRLSSRNRLTHPARETRDNVAFQGAVPWLGSCALLGWTIALQHCLGRAPRNRHGDKAGISLGVH